MKRRSSSAREKSRKRVGKVWDGTRKKGDGTKKRLPPKNRIVEEGFGERDV